MTLVEQLDSWYANPQIEVSYSKDQIRSLIQGDSGFSMSRLMALLSPEAGEYLEDMAQVALMKRKAHFGNAIKLFTPMYISNYCSNGCTYCAFKADNKIKRTQLDFSQVGKEAQSIADSGMRHILVLTGEAKNVATYEYLKGSLQEIGEHFSSVSIEVYPMEEDEYRGLVEEAHLDGLTLYQETYSRAAYKKYHPYGKKSDYDYRIYGPDRGCRGGVRALTVGSLLGLDHPLKELGALAIHLEYLNKKYPDVELSVSFPRLRPIVGSDLDIAYDVNDRFYAQILLAFRILFPHVGITLSTRENEKMRNGLIPLGVTKISAGVSTAVGSETTDNPSDEQFDIADERTVEEMCTWLEANGFQPVMHDWNSKLLSV